MMVVGGGGLCLRMRAFVDAISDKGWPKADRWRRRRCRNAVIVCYRAAGSVGDFAMNTGAV
jgi:hypothetical protein